ncbi:type VI secretion system baseplate subunit TssE [Marinomonas sp. RSW2]|uniref:Type VI secretion system baseplate subunit TssE n=1 Tax=Marinomonas maritima TaxID=2940935 RepID=A0ABT5WDV1_9GAMM|nr:type VI secretion system baseplate subunit TssE [Marinomonas maritima]MDE8602978.1 type VI secretion system baseplate subunit TssE [Marinomonas maritima]
MTNDSLQLPFIELIQDEAPESKIDRHRPEVEYYIQYKNSVMRDLQELLNSRCRSLNPFSEVKGDVLLTYGVTDFAHINISSLSGRDELRRKIQETLRLNEPRLSDINVTLSEEKIETNSLGFYIKAKLMFYGESEAVMITALFEPALKMFNFRSGR